MREGQNLQGLRDQGVVPEELEWETKNLQLELRQKPRIDIISKRFSTKNFNTTPP